MPQKRKRKPQVMPEAFVFEIREWNPSYSLAVNHDKRMQGPYWEHVGLELDTVCINPKQLAGRPALFSLHGRRDMFDFEQYKSDPDWKPACIGMLELPPTDGRFIAAIPNDSFGTLLVMFGSGVYRYITLSGPTLKRSRSYCDSFYLTKDIDPEDF